MIANVPLNPIHHAINRTCRSFKRRPHSIEHAEARFGANTIDNAALWTATIGQLLHARTTDIPNTKAKREAKKVEDYLDCVEEERKACIDGVNSEAQGMSAQ